MTMTDAPSRLGHIKDPESDPLLKELFEESRGQRGGRVLNLHLTQGHAPEISHAQRGVIRAIRTKTKAPQSLIELGILRAAQICNCEYEYVQHIPLSMKAGLTRAQVDAVQDWRNATVYDERQRAVLAWVEATCANLGEVDDVVFAGMQRHFSSQEILEITFTACLYFGTGVMMKALRIKLEPESRAEAEASL